MSNDTGTDLFYIGEMDSADLPAATDLPTPATDPTGPCAAPSAGGGLVEVGGRDRAALLNPRPVVLVGSCKDRANFATVAWVTPVSHDPALVAFALRPASKTFQDIMDTGCFSINTLDPALAGAAEFCGLHSGHATDKAAGVAHRLEPHHPLGEAPGDDETPAALVPFVEGALSVLDCEVESVRRTGDHSLVVGFVCRALTRCPRGDDGTVCATDTLLCVQRHRYAVASGICPHV
ncbi:MAG: flavin reductase family protein [Eggerthellaceae bacterium]|nr:flavin reductase family protein [Eggerthellaceae bacterium]